MDIDSFKVGDAVTVNSHGEAAHNMSGIVVGSNQNEQTKVVWYRVKFQLEDVDLGYNVEFYPYELVLIQDTNLNDILF